MMASGNYRLKLQTHHYNKSNAPKAETNRDRPNDRARRASSPADGSALSRRTLAGQGQAEGRYGLPLMATEADGPRPAEGPAPGDAAGLTAAQRARIERQRLRARTLRDARPSRPPPAPAPAAGAGDTGGGFLPAAPAAAPAAPRAPPAPLVDPALRPACELCGRRFAHSYLLDAFEHPVCDDCRDDAGEHALVTRTEAKAEFLLKDCDLDARPPPLACVRRRNPHRGAAADMRLYLRAQLAARALAVWGSAAALEAERARRREARGRAQAARAARRLRALRMDVRSGLYERAHRAHAHGYGPERLVDAADDRYERVCLECGHVDSYEKM